MEWLMTSFFVMRRALTLLFPFIDFVDDSDRRCGACCGTTLTGAVRFASSFPSLPIFFAMSGNLFLLTFVFGLLSLGLAVRDGPESDGPLDSVREETYDNEGAVWPLQGTFGDVGALAFHPNGELFFLHRGSHSWREDTFNESNFYAKFDDGPISEDVLVGVDSQTGEELHRWGRDRFFMPHGLFIQNDGSFWITDVALHQAVRVDPETLEVNLELGTPGVPGSGPDHFCKPTDVVVVSNGDIFVSDGYCNSRIVQFSPDGKYKSEFGHSPRSGIVPAPFDTFDIPHSLTYVPTYDMICVANREQQRIQCFSAGTQEGVPAGQPITQIAHHAMSRVFGLDYNDKLNKIYAVTSNGYSLEYKPPAVMSIDIATDTVKTWTPEKNNVEFVAPHDIAVSPDGKYIFIADIASRPRIWKLQNGDL